MSQTLREPRVYRRGPWRRFVEGLRYGGGVGQWSWAFHRLTGLGIALYLVGHILDTFLVVVSPRTYDMIIGLYGGIWHGESVLFLRWSFRLLEWALFASVLFHAINGVRIILFDFWPGAARIQRELFWAVLLLFIAIMIPVSWWMLSTLLQTHHPGG